MPGDRRQRRDADDLSWSLALPGLAPPPAVGRDGVLRLPGICLPAPRHHGEERQVHRVRPGSQPGSGQTDEQDRLWWHFRRLTNLTREQLTALIGPVIRGWLAYYGRFRHSELRPLLARINYRVQQWIRHKYRRLRAHKAMKRAWDRITAQMPGLLPHWRWETGAWY